VTASRETLPTYLVPTVLQRMNAADPSSAISTTTVGPISPSVASRRAPPKTCRGCSIAYRERNPPEPGDWNAKPCSSDIAGFGAAQDAMIEKVASDTLVGAVPPWVHLDATYASTILARAVGPSRDFDARFLRRYRDGAPRRHVRGSPATSGRSTR
jgi:hypothetical protein